MRDTFAAVSPRPLVSLRADDAVLHHVAPFGLAAALAAALGTALVVDLDPTAPTYAGRTIAALIADGVRRADLVPARRGVAVLGNGGADVAAALPIVTRLAEGWPAVVVRVTEPVPGIPLVPVRALLPDPLFVPGDAPAVYQATSRGARLPGRGVLLPPLGRGKMRSLLTGVVDSRWSWVRAWEPVGRLPWR